MLLRGDGISGIAQPHDFLVFPQPGIKALVDDAHQPFAFGDRDQGTHLVERADISCAWPSNSFRKDAVRAASFIKVARTEPRWLTYMSDLMVSICPPYSNFLAVLETAASNLCFVSRMEAIDQYPKVMVRATNAPVASSSFLPMVILDFIG